jgi:hypothetical protein
VISTTAIGTIFGVPTIYRLLMSRLQLFLGMSSLLSESDLLSTHHVIFLRREYVRHSVICGTKYPADPITLSAELSRRLSASDMALQLARDVRLSCSALCICLVGDAVRHCVEVILTPGGQ